jgi:NADP-dependent 3-hydroxy acid dehydrogenase YdfG
MGRATALALAAQGAKVVLGARGQEDLERVSDEIVARGGETAFVAIDVRKREGPKALVDLALNKFGRLDVLISNAGVMPIGPLDALAVDDWELMVDVNIKGVLYGIAAALPVFRKQKSGHFVHTASTAARKVVPNQAVYSGTKAAVLAISEGLRQETAKELRVTVILPGFTATNFLSGVKDQAMKAQLEKSAREFAMSPDVVAAAISYAIDQPEEVDVGEIVIRSTSQS